MASLRVVALPSRPSLRAGSRARVFDRAGRRAHRSALAGKLDSLCHRRRDNAQFVEARGQGDRTRLVERHRGRQHSHPHNDRERGKAVQVFHRSEFDQGKLRLRACPERDKVRRTDRAGAA